MSHSSYSDSSSYMPMNHVRSSSSMPVPIQQGHESPAGYMEMSGHMHLPPVKERGSECYAVFLFLLHFYINFLYLIQQKLVENIYHCIILSLCNSCRPF